MDKLEGKDKQQDDWKEQMYREQQEILARRRKTGGFIDENMEKEIAARRASYSSDEELKKMQKSQGDGDLVPAWKKVHPWTTRSRPGVRHATLERSKPRPRASNVTRGRSGLALLACASMLSSKQASKPTAQLRRPRRRAFALHRQGLCRQETHQE